MLDDADIIKIYHLTSLKEHPETPLMCEWDSSLGRLTSGVN